LAQELSKENTIKDSFEVLIYTMRDKTIDLELKVFILDSLNDLFYKYHQDEIVFP